MFKSWLTETFKIKYPILCAPMFLVTNEEMILAASKAGILGCIPALNYKTPELLREGLLSIKKKSLGPFGVNFIVNKSNPYFKKQLEICLEIEPDFIITALGNPKEVIRAFKGKKTKIICDIINLEMAKKCEVLGADALIAVNSGAGGHCGTLPASILIPTLLKNCSLPIISAGGVGDGKGLLSILSLGATGVSIGSPFIATTESPVGEDYKLACIQYGALDIVKTTKISGNPCTVIKTPYVEKIGTNQNLLENLLNQNKNIKKYAKMLTLYKGAKLIEKAAFSATYKTVWCAGPSIEFVKKIDSVKGVVDRLIREYEEALRFILWENSSLKKSSRSIPLR